MASRSLALFTLAGTTEYAEHLSRHLEVPLSPIEERSFEDGERKVRLSWISKAATPTLFTRFTVTRLRP